jgi:hypothetical protein
MSNEPVEVYCLGSYLAEEMEERGWTSVDVGMRMGGKSVDEHSMNIFIVDTILCCSATETMVIGADNYRALERAFGVSDGFFERLDSGWHDFPDRRVPFEVPDFLLSQ